MASSPNLYPGKDGFELWIQLLSVSDQGVVVNPWYAGNWLTHPPNPYLMSNSTEYPRKFGSIAMTASAKAYAVVMSANITEIQSWQVADDLINWSSTGKVDIGKAWS